MAAYEYIALDAFGKKKKGILEADTARQARNQLRSDALTPLEVNQVQADTTTQKVSLFSQGLSGADLALATRQLATLIDSGSPLEESLNTLTQQSDSRPIRRILSGVRSKILEGHTFASALKAYPNAFPPLYTATVGAGEKSGHLAAVLQRLADYTETRQHHAQKLSTAIIYPLFLLFVCIAIVIGLMKFVVPAVLDVFDTFQGELPGLTKALIVMSNGLENHGLKLLAAVVVLIVLGVYLYRIERIKWACHRFFLKLPLYGRLVRGVNAGQFARTLSILASSGVPILDSLKIAGQVVENLPMREAVKVTAVKVREGRAINRALQQTKMFPPMLIYLIASGENSGRLDDMLERAAIQQERENETRIARFVSLIEPIMMLSMGAIVLLIVLGIMLPIMKMSQLLG